MGFGVFEGGTDGVVKGGGGELVEGDAAGGAAGGGFGVEFGNRAREERDDREGGILGADLFDVVEALEIPGVDVDGQAVPAAESEGREKIGERVHRMDVEGRTGLAEEL